VKSFETKESWLKQKLRWNFIFREEVSIREDEFQALREEAQASKDVIGILKLQVEELQKEKNTL